MNANRNLLFAVIAFQNNFIDREQFLQVCTGWHDPRPGALGDRLVAEGWITADEQAALERIVAHRLAQQGGSVDRTLNALAADDIRPSVLALTRESLEATFTPVTLPPAAGAASRTALPPAGDPLRYTLTRLHARGGIGQVWLARDTHLDREVAYKDLRPDRGEPDNFAKRFLHEARVTGRLEHPNIVPVYELGSKPHSGEPFYTMRFIRGRTLAQEIRAFHGLQTAEGVARSEEAAAPPREEGPRPSAFASLPFRELLNSFVSVCNAVAYAHSKGVIHRDLKPGNVVLGEYGEVIVLDWGLAKVVHHPPSADGQGPTDRTTEIAADHPLTAFDGQQTQQGQVLGTPAYMAPEQAAGRLELLDQRTDVYGLGAILYELLTGKPPFGPDTTSRVLEQVGSKTPLPPQQVRAAVPKALEAVALKALAKRQEDRYGTARELAAEVQHWLADEPVRTYREPFIPRCRRWLRRHRTLTTSVAAVLIVSLLATTSGLILVASYNQQLVNANQQIQGARNDAVVAKEKAEEREADTQAVLEFVKDKVIAAARPEKQEGGLGREITLVAALKAALPAVESTYKDRPLVEAHLRDTLGTSFYHLGERDLSLAQHLRAFALRKDRLGADHPHTLTSMHNLANSLDALGRGNEALTLREETLQRRQATFGPDHVDTLKTLSNLAISYAQLGRLAEAEPLFEEALQRRKATLGSDDPDTLDSLGNLAAYCLAVGQHAKCIRLSEEALPLMRTKLGANQPRTLSTGNNLALAYAATGRHAEAVKLHKETLRAREDKLGPDHPHTLDSLFNLGLSQLELKDYPAAETSLREHQARVEKNARRLSPEYQSRAIPHLIRLYEASGKPAEAERWRKRLPQ